MGFEHLQLQLRPQLIGSLYIYIYIYRKTVQSPRVMHNIGKMTKSQLIEARMISFVVFYVSAFTAHADLQTFFMNFVKRCLKISASCENNNMKEKKMKAFWLLFVDSWSFFL